MSEIKVIELLGQGGISAAALVILGRIVWKIGLRMIAAIDRLIDRIDIHSRADTAAWAEVSMKVTESFQAVSRSMLEFRQEMSQGLLGFRREISQEMAKLRQDLAVLGTRVETVLDVDSLESSRRTPRPEPEDNHSHRSKPHRTRRDP